MLFETMTKKNYTQPTLEIMPFCAMNALCGSGEVEEGISGGNSGLNPYIHGRAPHCTPAY